LKFTVIITTAPYGQERAYSALRFALTSLLEGIDINIFLLEDGVYVAKTSQSNSTNATQNAIGTKQSNATQNATRTRQDNSTQNSINEDAAKMYQQLQKTQEKLQKIKKVMDALKG